MAGRGVGNACQSHPSLDASRARLEQLRRDPRVALTVLAADGWYAHVSLRGRVASLEPDEDLSDIDRFSTHYRGAPYPNRSDLRMSAWIEVTSWHSWQV